MKFKEYINEGQDLIKRQIKSGFHMSMDDNGNVDIQFGDRFGSMRTADIFEAIKEVESFTDRQLKNLTKEIKEMELVKKKIMKIKKDFS
jgi:hypothetical protein